MATVQQAIETNLPKGPTKNVLGHTKKTRAPVLGQQAQFMNTQGKYLSFLTRVLVEMSC